jgi:hypothetical protein
MTFDYCSPAELFTAKRKGGSRQRLGYRRFATAAEANTGAACSAPTTLIRVWRAIADSTRIIAALEEHYPEPPLYPVDTVTRQRAHALEDDLDETLGPALRAAIVTRTSH